MPILIHGNSKVPELQHKNVKSTTVQQEITPSEGYDGFNKIIVSPIKLQEKPATPSTSEQVITPDSTYDGLSKVTVGAVAKKRTWVGSKVSVHNGNVAGITFEVSTVDMIGFYMDTIGGFAAYHQMEIKTIFYLNSGDGSVFDIYYTAASDEHLESSTVKSNDSSKFWLNNITSSGFSININSSNLMYAENKIYLHTGWNYLYPIYVTGGSLIGTY